MQIAPAYQEQFGVQYLAQGHFDMQLSSERGFEPVIFQSEPSNFQSLANRLYPLPPTSRHPTPLPYPLNQEYLYALLGNNLEQLSLRISICPVKPQP